MYYYNARYYDPWLGRFVQADTVVPELGNPQDWNRFSYAANSPLRYLDPTGHWWAESADNPIFDPANVPQNAPQETPQFALPIDPNEVEGISGTYGQIEGYGYLHAGIDFNVKNEAEGVAAVYATHPGTVAYVRDAGLDGWGGGYGNAVWIKYEDPERGTLYIGSLHMYDTPSVSVGQEVKPGDQIGIVGNTGGSTGAHLHLEVRTREAWSDKGNKPKPGRCCPDSDDTDALHRDFVDPESIYPGLLDAYR